ncbi:hypothetical protein Clacol_010186 [Clathrus columnatus]|uniref:Uncharacterized protein n=1 Tax=Clathrus columnatus TaxID=1419009 RepID=A0AAV5ASC4_9AGAM|nr:hypothetical protein Clacol_010186 [Clathrus columnatus]
MCSNTKRTSFVLALGSNYILKQNVAVALRLARSHAHTYTYVLPPFPFGLYKIINVKNGNINTAPEPPAVNPVPVVAATEAAIWEVVPCGPIKLSFKVHYLVHILKGGQPANLDHKGHLKDDDKGIVVINVGAAPDVWCLHRVIENVYLIYYSRKGTEHHGESHWQLLSPVPGTNVIVDSDHHHPINKVLHEHILKGLDGSLDELTESLKVLHGHHPECFWVFDGVKSDWDLNPLTSFPFGLYEIINVKNGNINTTPEPAVNPVPVVAATEAAIWEVVPCGPIKLTFKVHYLVHILKGGQPANLDHKGHLKDSDKGIVVINVGARPDVWCLHRVTANVYLRTGTEHHGQSHWQLLSPVPGTNVIVDSDHHHPINRVLNEHILKGLDASLDELTEKLKVLHGHHPECFWIFNKVD